MTITGYSDRINHALAFAAKHHDQQVRKGTRLPYLTHPANVAVILTRYGRDDETVVAGILHDVIEDCVRESYTRAMLEQRIGDKFGHGALDTVLEVTLRRVDDDGVELAHDDRYDDYMERLAGASDRARWVSAADKVHNASTILADLRRTIDPQSVWSRFTGGKDDTIRGYRRVYDRLRAIGFTGEIMHEFGHVVTALENWTEATHAAELSS
ncbi:MAG TPA: HD domain-containing protein [Gemmatimonadaceae bacterium]|nr:HD domain-containing protein [Gemmatimonadaceae bacterium]